MASYHGRFLWYELLTTDVEAAKAFYAKVVGWRTRDVSMPGMSYSLFIATDAMIGGVMGLPPYVAGADALPRWIGYVGVDDVDAAADRVRQLGGTIRTPPTDVGDISRFAIVADPQLATLALIKGRQAPQQDPATLRARGRVSWHELLTTDCEQALAFYGELLGWQRGIAFPEPTGTYQQFSTGGQAIGALLTKPSNFPTPFWLYYFNVGDVDTAAQRVTAGGGQILNGPFEAPDGSWTLQCLDPQGAAFALIGKRSYQAVGFMERVLPRPSAK
jgi:predicted enzyme related to lactoylglutathione lyase